MKLDYVGRRGVGVGRGFAGRRKAGRLRAGRSTMRIKVMTSQGISISHDIYCTSSTVLGQHRYIVLDICRC
jgi:hypothetical protein